MGTRSQFEVLLATYPVWRWVRVSKGVALLAFFLPWITVSCSGQKLGSATGLQLVTGNITAKNPMTGVLERHIGDPNLLLGLAAVVFLIGFINACLPRGPNDKAPATVFCAAALSLVLVLAATLSITSATVARIFSGRQGAVDPIAASMLQVEYAAGFWIAVLALSIAIALSGLALRQDTEARDGGASPSGASLP